MHKVTFFLPALVATNSAVAHPGHGDLIGHAPLLGVMLIVALVTVVALLGWFRMQVGSER